MPRDLRTKRHFALRQFGGCSCSLGLAECTCFTACERPEEEEGEPVYLTEALWLILPWVVLCIGAVGLIVMVLSQ